MSNPCRVKQSDPIPVSNGKQNIYKYVLAVSRILKINVKSIYLFLILSYI